METNPLPGSLYDRFNSWMQESIMIKLFSIGFLILILLIPASWIENIMIERQQRSDDAANEIASKWSGPQILTGPILVIPFLKDEIFEDEKGKKKARTITANAYFLPEQLDIDGAIKTDVLHRGIFDAVVYESTLKINSTFTKTAFKTLSEVDEERILWKDAYLVLGISDLRGISENPDLKIKGHSVAAEPSNATLVSTARHTKKFTYEDVTWSETGIVANLDLSREKTFAGEVKIDLKLKGSSRLDFVPVGKTTKVKLASGWQNPSFDGQFLPVARDLTNGFSASWNVLHFNRPFSQTSAGDHLRLDGADFGVRLLMPVDQYQKSIRTAKYGILIILLTFMALFLVEVTQKVRIHPFQYILVGAALIIYYTVLLSLSEHLGYNLAYIIASAATVILVATYSKTFFSNERMFWYFGGLLGTFYAFIFLIILEQDYSLLIGSIGLFIIVGALMYFSRNVNWYRQRELNV